MATNRLKRTRKSIKPVIPAALYYYFETGNEDQSGFKETDRYNAFLIGFDRHEGKDIRDLWRLCRDEVIENWIRKHPGSRPFAFWQFDTPDHWQANESGAAFLKRHGLLTDYEKNYLKKHPEK